MEECRSDLFANGVDVARASGHELRRLARTHLDYFQFMLGYDAKPLEVVGLLHRLPRR